MIVEVGSKVIHNGEEKTVSEKYAEVLILNDKSVVAVDDVSVMPKIDSETNEENLPSEEERKELRRKIESINSSISAIDLMAIAKKVGIREIDFPVESEDSQKLDVERLKHQLLWVAVRRRLIEPKYCPSCGQIVEE